MKISIFHDFGIFWVFLLIFSKMVNFMKSVKYN